ncbi:MAG: outer membrane lipoprotein carrier protein LolA [Nitrospirota bacterium]|nr:outer membrane lipoprotein carrier protein LolA [Nitrospirota bacterium]MDH5585954.1 outer membrane lipoprotein carrier protein LolA [Nitrospirota bacterium]
MMLRIVFHLAVFSLILVVTYGIPAFAEKMDDVVNRVDQRYAKTQDLQGEFTQETIIEGFESGFKSTGKFYLKKPGLLRWDYLEPSKEHIYVDGDAVMMYVPEHQQVVKGRLTQIAASKGPLALLLGMGKLSQQFTVVESTDDSSPSQALPDLTLIPKPDGDTAPTIQKIELRLSSDSYLIQAITIFETSGNISRVHFHHLKANQGLAGDLLKFTLPPDVVVVDFPTF